MTVTVRRSFSSTLALIAGAFKCGAWSSCAMNACCREQVEDEVVRRVGHGVEAKAVVSAGGKRREIVEEEAWLQFMRGVVEWGIWRKGGWGGGACVER